MSSVTDDNHNTADGSDARTVSYGPKATPQPVKEVSNARSNCSGGIEGRPMSECIFVNRGENTARAPGRSGAEPPRNGWFARTRCSGEVPARPASRDPVC
jgi:hypothetical protein